MTSATLLPLGILFVCLLWFGSSLIWARYRDRQQRLEQRRESDDEHER